MSTILARLDQSIARSSRRAVHLDWYGGEPLLNAGFIEYASERIQAHVASRGLAYSASIISNGTGWPDDPLAFVQRHAIREVQISFDGDQEQHDRYRAFRTEQGSSFRAGGPRRRRCGGCLQGVGAAESGPPIGTVNRWISSLRNGSRMVSPAQSRCPSACPAGRVLEAIFLHGVLAAFGDGIRGAQTEDPPAVGWHGPD